MDSGGDTPLRRYLLETGAAADYVFRRRGVFQKASEATALGHRVGICVPVLLQYGRVIEQAGVISGILRVQ